MTSDLNKIYVTFVPTILIREFEFTFEVPSLSMSICADNWPKNLVYNPELLESDDMFYETLCSDTTLYFYVNSAARVCKSLVSRAVCNPDTIYEHGPIRVIEIEGSCPHNWMVRTKTEVAIRRLTECNKNE